MDGQTALEWIDQLRLGERACKALQRGVSERVALPHAAREGQRPNQAEKGLLSRW